MKQNKKELSPSSLINWQTTKEIAIHFQCSPRTVRNFMRCKVLPYAKIRNLVRFALSQCDQAFEHFRVKTRYENIQLPFDRPRHWKTKKQIAEHLQVSLRTITHLMQQNSLPFVKIGHVVRFDLADIDATLSQIQRKCLADKSTHNSA